MFGTSNIFSVGPEHEIVVEGGVKYRIKPSYAEVIGTENPPPSITIKNIINGKPVKTVCTTSINDTVIESVTVEFGIVELEYLCFGPTITRIDVPSSVVGNKGLDLLFGLKDVVVMCEEYSSTHNAHRTSPSSLCKLEFRDGLRWQTIMSNYSKKLMYYNNNQGLFIEIEKYRDGTPILINWDELINGTSDSIQLYQYNGKKDITKNSDMTMDYQDCVGLICININKLNGLKFDI